MFDDHVHKISKLAKVGIVTCLQNLEMLNNFYSCQGIDQKTGKMLSRENVYYTTHYTNV